MRIVKVRFRTADTLHLYNAGDVNVKWRDILVVEADRGIRIARAVSDVEELKDEPEEKLRKVLRVATEEDLKKQTENEKKEEEAFRITQKKIQKHKLNMKLIEAEYYLDRAKIIFYFTAETRVDFRGLVRDLAKTFKTRVELRQIGIRDEAKLVGAIGPCGQISCCSLWLDRFDSITVKMLRDQNIMLNPVKYSGMCGRLMCCLAYEQDMYLKLKESYPPVGARVLTPKGRGKVVLQDVISENVVVKLDDDVEGKFKLNEITLDEEES